MTNPDDEEEEEDTFTLPGDNGAIDARRTAPAGMASFASPPGRGDDGDVMDVPLDLEGDDAR